MAGATLSTPRFVHPPEVRIRLITRSVRCFTCGILGLIPLLGLPLGLVAVAMFVRLRRENRNGWNPAQSHARWGLAFALTSILANGIMILMLALAWIDNMTN